MGAPFGSRNSAHGRRWKEAIDRALKRFEDKKLKVQAGQALDRIAEKVVKAALEGDWWAVAEIGNRLDGKPAQSIDFTDHTPRDRDLTDEELLERLEQARRAAGTLKPTTSPEDTGELHPIHKRPLDS